MLVGQKQKRFTIAEIESVLHPLAREYALYSLWIRIPLQLRLTCWNEIGTGSKTGTSYSRMAILRKGAQRDCSRLKSLSIK